MILWHLQDGALRHGELAAQLPGIAPKVLAERLEGLEQRGLVQRAALATFPRGVLYGLSPRGEGLIAILDRIEAWSRSSACPGDA